MKDQENPGNKPFSEDETLHNLISVKNFKPLVFLSIHSGIFGLFLPYAFEASNFNRSK